MRKVIPAILIFCFCSVLNGFTQKQNFQIVFYNVENLFDTLNDPNIDDEEFLPNGKNKWTSERYNSKIRNTSRVLDSISKGRFPDLIGFCEIENSSVLQELASQKGLKEHNYQVLHFDSPDGRGIDVGFLLKTKAAKLIENRYISTELPAFKEFKTRNIQMLLLEVNGRKLAAYVNHWPSKRNNDKAAPQRLEVAKILKRVMDSMAIAYPNIGQIAMGDFNNDCNEEALKDGLMASAPTNTSAPYYDLMIPLSIQGKGSHFYDNKWSFLDHFIVSPNITNGPYFSIAPLGYDVFKPEFVLQQDGKYKGHPFRTYAGNKYLGGYSDHMAITLILNVEAPIVEKALKQPKVKKAKGAVKATKR